MKLMQLNTWMLRLDKQIYDLAKYQSSDIACLQEVISTNGDPGILGSLETLQSKANFSYDYSSPVISFGYFGKTAYFGNAILSKLPICEEKTIFTNLAFKENFSFDKDNYNVRNFQHVVLQTEKGKVNILNHHGYHINEHKNGNTETMRQMKIIKDYLDKLSGPTILAGDFNLAPDSESIGLINASYTNLSIKFGLKTTRTNFTPKNEVCDYIFVNDKVKVNDFYASDDVVSDHKALILDFDI